MRKRYASTLSLLMSLLLAFSLVLPAAHVLAAENEATELPAADTNAPAEPAPAEATPASEEPAPAEATPAESAPIPEEAIPAPVVTPAAQAPSVSQTSASTLLPPSNLAYQLVSPDDVKLTWDAVYQATGYNVYGIIDGELRLMGTPKTNSFSLNDLAEGSYGFVVSTLSTDGESGPCAPVEVEIVYPEMAAPTALTFTVKNLTDIVLNWDASTYAGTYNLYQIAENGDKTLVAAVTGRTYTVTQASTGVYTYAVSAANSLYGESPLSEPVTVEVGDVKMEPPGNVTYTVANGNDVNLKWNAAANANNYKIYQLINGEKVLKSTATTTSASLTNMPAGEYTFVIHSNSTRFGESEAGSEISLTLVHPTMTAPTNFTHTMANINDVTMKWDAVPFANSYKLYQIIDGQKVLKNTLTTTSAAFTNVSAGEYTYVIHSFSSRFGESAEGSQLSFSVETPTMLAPSNVTYKIQNGNDIVLNWDAAANANSYKIYQVSDGQKLLKSTVTTLTATLANVPAGEYTYEVHAVSTRYGESQEGSQVSISLVHPVMQPPLNVVQTITGASSFTLKWEAALYANSYKVYQIIDGQKVLKSTVSTTSAAFANMAPGQYTYEVTAVSSRFGESAQATSLTFNLNGQTMPTPANLTYTIANGNDITLKWGTTQYATSYKVYQVIDGEKVLKSTVTGTTVTYTNLPGGDYTFVVTAVSTLFGESPTGAETSFKLVLPTVAAPGNFTYKLQNINDVVLNWGSVTYANSYNVYEIVNGEPVLQKKVTGLTVTLTNVPIGSHTYEVRAVSTRFGESPTGSQVTLQLADVTMPAPSNLTHSITNGNQINLSWTAVPNATGYKVYQIVAGDKVLLKTQAATTVSFANMPAGDYLYEVHSYNDRFGESPEGSQVSVSLVHPTMQVPGTLTHTIVNGNDITLKWGTALYATSYKLYQIINGEKVLQKTQTATTVTLTNMPAGEYTYVVHSYSDRFGESPVGSTVNLSLVWPVVQPPTLKSTIVNANNVTLSWPAVQWANEYRVYKVTGAEREMLGNATTTSYSVYNLPEDTFSYEVTAFSSRFGESAASNRETVTIVYPEMQAPTATAKVLSANSARISWNFVTYANGYNVYEIIDGQPVLLVKNLNALSYTLTNMTIAKHEYYVTSYSNSFGESAPSNTVVAQLITDDVAPVTTAQAPMGWTNQTAVVTLSATDNDTGVAKTFYSLNGSAFAEGTSITVNAEGIHSISFYSVDKMGNVEKTKTIEVKIDKTAPVTTVSAPAGWLKADATVTLTATDAQSGVAKTYYSINGSEYAEGTTFSVGTEGVNKITFYTVDQAGNQEAVQTIEVKIDKTAAVTTANAPADWSNEPVTVTLTATDKHSGVEKTYYSINGAPYVEGTNFTVAQEGVNVITFYTVDRAGNQEAPQTVEVKIATPSAPTIQFDLRDEYPILTWFKPKYTIDGNLSKIVKEKITLSGPLMKDMVLSKHIGTLLLLPGRYTLTVEITDATGKVTKAQHQFQVYVPICIDVTPGVIKGNSGVFTVRAVLPTGYITEGFDLNTVTLNGVKALNSNNGYYNQAKKGQFKFERSDFDWTSPKVGLEFRGYVHGILVKGYTTVTVKK